MFPEVKLLDVKNSAYLCRSLIPSTVSKGFWVNSGYDWTAENLDHGFQRFLLRVVRLFVLEAREGACEEELQRDEQLGGPDSVEQFFDAVQFLVVQAERGDDLEEVPGGGEEAFGGLFVDLLDGRLLLAVRVVGLDLHVVVIGMQVHRADEFFVEVVVLEEEVETENLEVLLGAFDEHELGLLVDLALVDGLELAGQELAEVDGGVELALLEVLAEDDFDDLGHQVAVVQLGDVCEQQVLEDVEDDLALEGRHRGALLEQRLEQVDDVDEVDVAVRRRAARVLFGHLDHLFEDEADLDVEVARVVDVDRRGRPLVQLFVELGGELEVRVFCGDRGVRWVCR